METCHVAEHCTERERVLSEVKIDATSITSRADQLAWWGQYKSQSKYVLKSK